MIKLASFLVISIGAMFALGAFYLARGSGDDTPRVVITEVAPAPEPIPTPVVPEPDLPEYEELYYLNEIDFEQGDITVVYLGLGPAANSLIVRDQAALRAVKETAYLNSEITDETETGSLALLASASASVAPVLQIFRDDTLIASVDCIAASCDVAAIVPEESQTQLFSQASPHQIVDDVFHDHETYLNTISAIAENPNFMFLNKRPHENFPAAAIEPTLKISLPTAAIQSFNAFDSSIFEALIRDAINQQLPEGAQIINVTTDGPQPAYIADKDSQQFVTAAGQPIAFPNARFLPLSVEITGADHLSDAAYDAITEATLLEFDLGSEFAEFVTTRLQTSCVDCYFLKMNGSFFQSARPTTSTIERYDLSYYDLREGP